LLNYAISIAEQLHPPPKFLLLIRFKYYHLIVYPLLFCSLWIHELLFLLIIRSYNGFGCRQCPRFFQVESLLPPKLAGAGAAFPCFPLAEIEDGPVQDEGCDGLSAHINVMGNCVQPHCCQNVLRRRIYPGTSVSLCRHHTRQTTRRLQMEAFKALHCRR
jgi:hypothetical protein